MKSSPLSLQTEIPNKNTAFNSPESHHTVPPPSVFGFPTNFVVVFSTKILGFSSLRNSLILFIFGFFLNKRIEKIGKFLHAFFGIFRQVFNITKIEKMPSLLKP